jgi:CubicO group peptidase (beta-lactamase class C family)
VANVDSRKRAMTLEDLLTMSSGLDCQDSYLYRWRGMSEMRRSVDWVQHMLDLPMAHEPGAHFEYCNGGSYLLAAIVQQASGTSALDFGREHLFGPLGIEEVEWPASPQGINLGWGDMRLQPRDMAKFGYLYLQHGVWDGQQVVPAWWVDASTQAQVSAGTLADDYGYQWWVDAGDYYMALGYAGQVIVVVPELEMVVVFTSDLEERDFFVPETLLRTYILPAAVKSGSLPENPEGVARLQALTEAVASPRP